MEERYKPFRRRVVDRMDAAAPAELPRDVADTVLAEVLADLTHNGTGYLRGATIALPPAQAEALRAARVIRF